MNFVVDEIEYKSAEHYMMAEKAKLFEEKETRKEIIQCNSPAAAKKLGRIVKKFSQAAWESSRYNIVKVGNLQKFSQNKELANILLKTNKRILVEASPVDPIWGIGIAQDHNNAANPKKWRGLNLLGFALMEVRDQLAKNYGCN